MVSVRPGAPGVRPCVRNGWRGNWTGFRPGWQAELGGGVTAGVRWAGFCRSGRAVLAPRGPTRYAMSVLAVRAPLDPTYRIRGSGCGEVARRAGFSASRQRELPE